jgi:hypothetical protein
MHNDTDHITIEFHNQAKGVFFNLINEFQSSVKNINRKTEEYLFQQSKEKFVHTLKQQLEIIASKILKENNDHENINEINKTLQRFINNYLHQFVQKVRAA